MEQKQLNLQLVNSRGINIMEERAVMNGHLKAVNGVFKFSLKDGVKRRPEDMPIITEREVELYQNWCNNDVDVELHEVGQLLASALGVIHKHKGRNYQEKLSRVLIDMSNVLEGACADFRTLLGITEDHFDPDDFMTANELEARKQDGDPDAAYDDLREGGDHA